MEIFSPPNFHMDSIDKFIFEIEKTKDYYEEVKINFSHLSYSTPIAMMLVANTIRRWVQYRSRNGHLSSAKGFNEKKPAHSYLMHLGFFDFIFLTIGKKVGEAKGSTRYLPITKLTRPNITVTTENRDDWYQEIESQARKLAVLIQGSANETQELKLYQYSLREIIRNSFEHSGSEVCYICGQRWIDGRAEISVIDEGIGIIQTLKDIYPFKQDQEILEESTKPGISRTMGYSDFDNIYDNSGFGLYVLKHIGSSFGAFHLSSNESRIEVKNNTIESFNSLLKGTCIGLKIEKTPKDFRSLLGDIIRTGEEDLESEGILRKASAKSKLAY